MSLSNRLKRLEALERAAERARAEAEEARRPYDIETVVRILCGELPPEQQPGPIKIVLYDYGPRPGKWRRDAGDDGDVDAGNEPNPGP